MIVKLIISEIGNSGSRYCTYKPVCYTLGICCVHGDYLVLRVLQMAAQQPIDQRLAELETKMLELTSDNALLRVENIRLQGENSKLRQSLDQAKKNSREEAQNVTEGNNGARTAHQQQQPHPGTAQANPDTTDAAVSGGIWEHVMQISKQLCETRKELSSVQERLTSSDQVTAATQARELRDEGIYEKLRTENRDDHVYETLIKELNQLTTKGGIFS